MRIELTTSSLPRKCSTPELQQLEEVLLVYFKKLSTLKVGSGGFEPPKSKTADLQSAPFGHSGNCPFILTELPRFDYYVNNWYTTI